MQNSCVYIAPRFYEHELKKELSHLGIPILHQFGRFFHVKKTDHQPVWAQNTWFEPQLMPINSINDGANKLKQIQRNWYSCPIDFFRRVKLIEEKLPHINFKPHNFGDPNPTAKLGAWTLLEPNTILYSTKLSSPFPHGEIIFNENKIEPPSRAYLKLWEIFTICETFPQENDTAIDLGACPGGWTWVMAKHNVHTLAVDKAEIDKNIATMPYVTYLDQSGFSLLPQDYANTTWLLSDMACYPKRLYELTQKWIEKAQIKNFIFTLKLQGEETQEQIDLFRKIKNSSIIHLSCNKHELTWIYGDIQRNLKKKLDFIMSNN